MNIEEQKTALREDARAQRTTIADEARQELESALEDRLLNLPATKHAKHIAVYNPIGSEARYVANIDTLFVLEQHPVIAFPLVASDTEMFFGSFEMDDDRSVLANPLQRVSAFDPTRVVNPLDIDLILVPGLAFDKHGNRLGQGSGFYDRYLPTLRKDCLVVGIAFDEQLVDEVPCGPNDCKVDYIVTPTRIISAEK